MKAVLQPRHYRYLGYALIGSIHFLSLMPGSSLPRLGWDQLLGIDKIFHFASYGLTAYCFLKSMDGRAAFKIGLTLFVMGLYLECLQKLIPGDRFFDVADLVANLAGILAAVGIFHYVSKKISPE